MTRTLQAQNGFVILTQVREEEFKTLNGLIVPTSTGKSPTKLYKVLHDVMIEHEFFFMADDIVLIKGYPTICEIDGTVYYICAIDDVIAEVCDGCAKSNVEE